MVHSVQLDGTAGFEIRKIYRGIGRKWNKILAHVFFALYDIGQEHKRARGVDDVHDVHDREDLLAECFAFR
jgi:hypothetical protein